MPLIPIIGDLAREYQTLEPDGDVYRVTGAFVNPIPVAARIATLLGLHLDTALVHAVAGSRWAFVAWRPPHLVVVGSPSMWPGWRLYNAPPSSTPVSRLSGGESPPRSGLVAGPVPLGRTPPPVAVEVLEQAGVDHVALLRRMLDHGS